MESCSTCQSLEQQLAEAEKANSRLIDRIGYINDQWTQADMARQDMELEIEKLEQEVERLRGAVSLLNSMVESGEQHSPKSRQIVDQALEGGKDG